VIGSSGVWSDTWTFSVASAQVVPTATPTPIPEPTQQPTPVPTQRPVPTPTPRPSVHPVISLGSINENPNGDGFVLDFTVTGGNPDSIVIKRDGVVIATVTGSTREYVDSGTTKSPKKGDTIVYEVDAVVNGKVVSHDSMTLAPLST